METKKSFFLTGRGAYVGNRKQNGLIGGNKRHWLTSSAFRDCGVSYFGVEDERIRVACARVKEEWKFDPCDVTCLNEI